MSSCSTTHNVTDSINRDKSHFDIVNSSCSCISIIYMYAKSARIVRKIRYPIRPALRQLIQKYRNSGYPLFRSIADTLDYHFESIINSFIIMERYCADSTHLSRLSNGPMESLNRIAKDLKRNGRGFRNFEHICNRFLFAERKNAQMLASPLPPEKYQVKTGIKRGSHKKK